MNIFNNKYKSNIIAAIVSLAFYVILFLLLIIIPSSDSSSKFKEDQKDKDVSIQFQIMDEIASIPPPASPSPSQSKADTKLTEKATKEIDNNTDESKDFDQSNDETSVIENQDSVILAQLKKSLEVFKEIVPADSLAKNPIQQKNIQKVSKSIAEKTHFTEEDWQFIRNNYQTIQSIRRVYPYVQKTKEIVDKLNKQLANIKSNKERHRLIKETEKELFKEFESDVHRMSYSQGKLLLKLIARETNQTAFGLIKTYKGGLPATFWYGVGLLFHEDLKVKYDSIGEDAVLEKIIQKYKLGKL